MKNILRHKQFVSETLGIIIDDQKYDEVVRYIDIFMDTKLTDNDRLSFKNGYYAKDYKKHIDKLKKFIQNKLGYNLDDFMIKFKSKIYSDDFFTSNCGFIDALLYTYDSNFPLSGDILQDYGAGDEYVIKYDYGYDMYDLGRKYILQNYESLEDFYYDCAIKYWSAENENLFNIDNLEKEEINFATVDKLKDGSITILDINKLFNLYHSWDFKKRFNVGIFKDIKTLTNHILTAFNSYVTVRKKNNIKPFNFKYNEHYNMVIVAFGNVNLDNIKLKDFKNYKEQIDINSNLKKYGL